MFWTNCPIHEGHTSPHTKLPGSAAQVFVPDTTAHPQRSCGVGLELFWWHNIRLVVFMSWPMAVYWLFPHSGLLCPVVKPHSGFAPRGHFLRQSPPPGSRPTQSGPMLMTSPLRQGGIFRPVEFHFQTMPDWSIIMIIISCVFLFFSFFPLQLLSVCFVSSTAKS